MAEPQVPFTVVAGHVVDHGLVYPLQIYVPKAVTSETYVVPGVSPVTLIDVPVMLPLEIPYVHHPLDRTHPEGQAAVSNKAPYFVAPVTALQLPIVSVAELPLDTQLAPAKAGA